MSQKFSQQERKHAHKLFIGKDDTGHQAWWLVEISALKNPLLKHDAKNGRVEFTNYGKIIDSGYGEAPQSNS